MATRDYFDYYSIPYPKDAWPGFKAARTFTVPEPALTQVNPYTWKIDLKELTHEQINAFIRKMYPMYPTSHHFGSFPTPAPTSPDTVSVKTQKTGIEGARCRAEAGARRAQEARKELEMALQSEAKAHAEITELEAAIKKLAK